MTIVICVAVFLVIALAIVLEILVAGKRGGCLSSFRAFTVILAGIIGAGLAFLFGFLFANEKYIPLSAELQPLVHDVAYAFAIPVVALLLFLLLKLIMLIVYAIGGSNLKKGKHAEACAPANPVNKKKGLICGAVIAVIVVGFLAIPVYRGISLLQDYKANEDSMMTVYNYSTGGQVSNSEMIDAVEKLSNYILDVNYISDDAKVKAINYGIGLVNSMLADSGNSALGNLSLGTYDSIEEHKQQVESLVDIAKTLDETGILDTVTADGTDGNQSIDADKIIDAISDEDNARAFVEAVGSLENGNEMLAGVLNDTIAEMSGGLMVNLIDEEAVANSENTEALVQTLTHASVFMNLNMNDFQNMSNEEKQELIGQINEISSYGILDPAMMNIIISQIEDSMSE